MDTLKQFFGFSEEDTSVDDLPVTKKRSGKSTSLSEIKIESPQVYDDSIQLASFLREGKPIIVNLEKLDETTANRFVDFLCGTSYAINGHMFKLAAHLYLFTPAHILIIESEAVTDFEKGVVQDQLASSQLSSDSY